MSLFRRTFSRRYPDHLVEISQRVYVFDSCMSIATINENDFKTYLGEVVTSLQRFHAGASFMVFNFREGDQISLLSDILIDYDMAVVDYPRNHEGYPLLQLEMINYFLRSSESWLSLGPKNVILMHCEKGGWPVLAFMLTGLLLYRKQNSGEQKTLETVYKMAPKQLFSALSPINARPSQLRYLQYITGRDSGSDWPPPDAHLLVDCLLLHNLPLFDGGKGCRPVVRVFGQDPSEKSNRDPRLLLSTLMAEEPAWLYPKEECVVVKLQLLCQVQGDVFLECTHLYDDLVTEELIFKVMFHTGFIQSNILALSSGDIDVPWNPKYQLPKDFKAEVLFRDINEAPPQITMELGGGEEYRDSDNEFFEVEEILTPIPGSPEKKAGFKITTDQEDGVLDSKSRDCTLHNGAPRWDLESEVSDLAALKDIAFVRGNVEHIKDIEVTEVESIKERAIEVEQPKDNKLSLGADIVPIESENILIGYRNDIQASPTSGSEFDRQALETKSDVRVSENIGVVDFGNQKEASKTLSEVRADEVGDIPASEAELAESVTSMSKNIAVDGNNHIQASGADSGVKASRNIVLVDDMYHNEVPEIQTEARALEKEMDVGAPVSGEESGINISRNIVLVDDIFRNEAMETKSDAEALENEMDVSVPTSGAESGIDTSGNFVLVDDMYHKEASETKPEARASEKEINVSERNSGTESGMTMPRNIVLVDNMYHKEVSETRSEAQVPEKEVDVSAPVLGAESGIKVSRNNVVVDSMYDKQVSETPSASEKRQTLEKEMVVVAPVSEVESEINMSTNNVMINGMHLKEVLEKRSEGQVSEGINIVLVDDMYKEVSETKSDTHAVEKEMDVSVPTSGAESGIDMSGNFVPVDDMYHKEASETKPEAQVLEKEVSETRSEAKAAEKEIDVSAPDSGADLGIITSRDFVLVDDMHHIEASETQSEVQVLEKEMVISEPASGAESGMISSRNVVVADNMYHKEASETQSEGQALEKEMVIVAPVSEAESGMNMSRNDVVVDGMHLKEVSETRSEGHVPQKEVDVSAPVSGDMYYKEVSGTQSEAQVLLKEMYVSEPVLGAESGINMSRNNVVVDGMYLKDDLETQSEANVPEKEMGVSAAASGAESVIASRNVALADDKYYKEVSETQTESHALEKEIYVSEGISGAESVINMSRNDDVVDGMYLKEVLGTQSEAKVPEKEMDVSAAVSEAESGIITSRNVALVDDKYYNEVSDTQSEAKTLEKEMYVCEPPSGAESGINMSRNDVLVDSIYNEKVSETPSEAQAPEKEMDVSARVTGAESGISTSWNNVLVDSMSDKEVSEIGSVAQVPEKETEVSAPVSEAESEIIKSRNFVVVGDTYQKEASETQSEAQAPEKEMVVSAPVSGEESGLITPRNNVMADNMCDKEVSETRSVAQDLEKEMDVSALASDAESGTKMSGNTVLVDNMDHKETSETQSEKNADDGHDTPHLRAEFFTHAFKNIIVDESNHIHAQEKEMDVSALASGAESGTKMSRNTDLVDNMDHKKSLETQSGKKADDGQDSPYLRAEFFTHAFKSIIVDESNHIHAQEKEIVVSIPASRVETDISASKNIVVDDETDLDIGESKNNSVVDIRNHEEALETQSEVIQASGAESVTQALKNIVVDDSNHTQSREMDHKQATEKDIDVNAGTNTVAGDTKNHGEASETRPDINVAKNIKVVDDGSQIQQVKVEIQPKSVPSSSKPKQIKKNKWQEMAAKTITQQRVVSQWVPRAKPQAPEPAKAKATAYKWVPKGAAPPTSEK
ncbi:hypothetical protein RND81_03G136200 [Saponaria officinalis]|uniref:C2 tensin-type domain-containing protein n=1 Tax=Saponaria officinalis TaxID=3572 RepID=A0AAW1MAI6_SAPOF